ncbi:MAG: peroxiredoxin [Planctomycetes bacterium]|nr:peroxiredoxin [Planctomycetota bacterium]
MPLLKIGSKIPAFLLKDGAGTSFGAHDLRGRYTVIYFYPRDDTPGCTIEACEFRDLAETFAGLNAQVVGVSSDSAESHRKFAEKFALNFRLIVDLPDSIGRSPFAMKFGAWQRKIMYGKSSMGVVRTTFLIAPDCTVAKRWDKVKPEGHAKEVAEAVAELLKHAKDHKRAATRATTQAKNTKHAKKMKAAKR